ncbi:MAG: VCBS repeat-containing protein [Bryobacteraceae bacterium]
MAVSAVLACAACAASAWAGERTAARTRWDLMLLDADPEEMIEPDSTAVSDIDGDGKLELLIGGRGGMLWYRPATFEKGVISRGEFHCAMAVLDLDGDGRKEIVAGRVVPGSNPPRWALYWFKPSKDLKSLAAEHIIDPDLGGGPHDVIAVDLDGDGKLEIVANAMYTATPGLYAYKPGADVTEPWKKQVVQTGLSAEGTSAGSIEGQGKVDIVSGPYWFSPPAAGPFSGQAWGRHQVAPGFREMCRSAVIDVNADGRQDVVVAEDEYPDGRISWFENRGGADPRNRWVEHPIEDRLYFPHTLQLWRDSKTHDLNLFLAEMNAGGWESPYDYDARLIRYVLNGSGRMAQREVLYQGEGTHEAMFVDLDGDGIPEIVGHAGQVLYKKWPDTLGWIQIYKQRPADAPLPTAQHEFIDREKPGTGTDILYADVDGDGLPDVICGSWWYRNPGWERYAIPGVEQVLSTYDLDRDGRQELIVMKSKPGAKDWYNALSSDLAWIKPVDPKSGRWEEHAIGSGSGDWPHSTFVAPLLPGGQLALVAGYHNRAHPEIFEVPQNPALSPWPRRVLAEIPYGEEMLPFDLDRDGKLDIVAGPYWLENRGHGEFVPHTLVEGYGSVARIAIADMNGDGKPDIVVAEENVDYDIRKSILARVAWFENTGDPRQRAFTPHVVDQIRSPHSLAVADIDGDGRPEIIASEHDPFKPYRSRNRLFAYKQAEPRATAWFRYLLDDRFEQHDGAKLIKLGTNQFGLLGHGWAESRYVHLWTLTWPK